MATVTSPRESLSNVHPVSPEIERAVLGTYSSMEAEANQRWTIIEGPHRQKKQSLMMKVVCLKVAGRSINEIGQILNMPRTVAVDQVAKFRQLTPLTIKQLAVLCQGKTEQEVKSLLRDEVRHGYLYKAYRENRGVA